MSKRKAVGIILIVLGILCAGLLILCSIHHAAYMWDAEMKSRNFDTFAEYYFTASKGALLLTGCIGTAFVASGIHLLTRKP